MNQRLKQGNYLYFCSERFLHFSCKSTMRQAFAPQDLIDLSFIFILQVGTSCLESSVSLRPTDYRRTAAFLRLNHLCVAQHISLCKSFTGNTTGNSLESIINFDVHNPGNNLKRISPGCQPGFIILRRGTLHLCVLIIQECPPEPSRHTVLRLEIKQWHHYIITFQFS